VTEKVIEKKLRIFMALVTVIFLVLISRLALLQIVQTQEFKTMSEQNRIRLVPIPAKRGEILDRNGKVLVQDRPVYSVSVFNLEMTKQDLHKLADRLASMLGMKSADIIAAMNDKLVKKYEPIKIAKDVPLDIVAKIKENQAELPGVEVNVEPMRDYVFKDFMPHIFGYVREISPAQLEKHKDEGYSLGDRFGQAGLENQYQSYLQGKDGDSMVEVDKSQHPVRSPVDIRQPIPGNNLVLNIDAKVQKAAEESLDRTMAMLQKGKFPDAKAGAVVMIDVKTGKVLTMASKPGFDPNIFNGKMTPAQSEALFGSKTKNPFPAFNNRAMMGYAPGSTFKMVTATAVLESKKATIDDTYVDHGSVYLYGRSYKCWVSGGHGTVNLIKAIKVSCNVYFYQMGLRAGVDNLVKYAREYGLGQKTGIDLLNESAGRVPSPEWKKDLNEQALKDKYEKIYQKIEDKYSVLINKAATEKERKKLTTQKNQELNQQKAQYKIDYRWQVDWQPFETIIMSIGQGGNYYTPLQMANYIATIANGGTRYQPYLVDRVVDYQGKVVKQFDKKAVSHVTVSPATLATVRRGMRAVVEPGGTAYSIFSNFPVPIAGKTGSAQTGKDKYGNDKPTHGWFVAFAPYDNPQVAVASVVEYAGHGGSSAGLVCRDVLAAYFNIDKTQVKQGGVSDE